jgi:hypothetical protein
LAAGTRARARVRERRRERGAEKVAAGRVGGGVVRQSKKGSGRAG